MSATATFDDVPARKRASSLPPEERRAMIVDATMRLLLERGEMVNSQEIAAAAGIAEGTIFRVFESKDELIQAVVDRAFDSEPIERAISEIDVDLPLERALTQAIALIQQRTLQIWNLVSVVGGFADHKRRPPVESPALTRLLSAHRDELNVKPAQAARLLRSFTFATTHPLIAIEPMRPADVAHRFLYGVAERPC